MIRFYAYNKCRKMINCFEKLILLILRVLTKLPKILWYSNIFFSVLVQRLGYLYIPKYSHFILYPLPINFFSQINLIVPTSNWVPKIVPPRTRFLVGNVPHSRSRTTFMFPYHVPKQTATWVTMALPSRFKDVRQLLVIHLGYTRSNILYQCQLVMTTDPVSSLLRTHPMS